MLHFASIVISYGVTTLAIFLKNLFAIGKGIVTHTVHTVGLTEVAKNKVFTLKYLCDFLVSSWIRSFVNDWIKANECIHKNSESLLSGVTLTTQKRNKWYKFMTEQSWLFPSEPIL